MDQGTRPCNFPTCRDGDGNRRLTRDGMCPGCQSHYGRLLEWIGWDFVTIRQSMPTPVSTGEAKTRTAAVREFGHPREWASSKLSEIADALSHWEGALRRHLGEGYAADLSISEPRRVALALDYLRRRFAALCYFPAAEQAAREFQRLHGGVRTALRGASRYQHLPVPCESCEALTMFRETVQGGEDAIKCHSCGEQMRTELYPFYTRMILDRVLDHNRQLDACA